MKTGELLTELHRIMGETDGLNRELSLLKASRKDVEAQLLQHAADQGVDSLSNGLVSVTVKDDFIAAYDPEMWSELVSDCVRTGNTHIIQRRISTKPVQELIDNGSEIPAGVRLEPQTKLLVRRK